MRIYISIINRLAANKGAVSSSLSKELAEAALNGVDNILKEAVSLAVYDNTEADSKNIRSGAAKIVEIVAEKKLETIASYLENLLPALEVKEP